MTERILTELVESFWKLFMVGLKVTIPLTLAAFSTGLLIAFLVALVQIAKVPVMKRLVRVYIWIIRCTPMIVQLFVVYFGLPTIGIKFNSFTSAWIVMSLSIGAYCSETVRAAIESVPVGQLEACYCDGLTFWQAMIHVIVPQALRTAFPPLSNSIIGLVKDTSLAYSVALVEILATAQRIAARTYDYFWLYLEAGLIYLIFCSILTVLQRKAEAALERRR
ncbi:MAG: amino acid ABC transporter permease [Firmicutes bacterium]|nr:amino acid ABC transporter permease [Bacillota bacterium]